MTVSKQVNFRFDSNVSKMLDALVEHYSIGKYTKVTKTGVMQEMIAKEYREKIEKNN